ncbi:GNAT family N-acetyltransferase [Bauldia sp.]|uniref:GNAT family N-acetyltransferase n=1 Tax=Bauldia sp. TaxID=2575872 RepID=UPI003BA9EA32
MEACRDELTLRPIDLATSSVAVAEQAGAVTGVVQVSVEDDTAELDKLFVDPDALRGGLGRLLFAWAVAEARRLGAVGMTIDADPDAVPFYRRMGGVDDGVAPSASIPGRVLPRLVVDLGN